MNPVASAAIRPCRQAVRRTPVGSTFVLLLLATLGAPSVMALAQGQPQAKSEVASRYVDHASGFTLVIPKGWRKLGDREIPLPPGAQAGFVDARGDVIVYVKVEFVPGGEIPRGDAGIGQYLTRAMYASGPR